MTLIEQFEEKFKPLLGHTQRWDAFHFIAKRLLSKRPRIVETGCVHYPNDWEGQGASTQIWDWIVDHTDGIAYSVDISEENVGVAQSICRNVDVFCQDSIQFLSQIVLKHVDLLFLDSWDTNPPYAHAYLHAAGELAAAYHKLPSGCLIAVDDCNLSSPKGGKDYFITQFFEGLEITPVVRGYITIWQKP